MRRFLFYSHDGPGLGHVRRDLAVAKTLVEVAPDASILVVTGADRVESLEGAAARKRPQACRPPRAFRRFDPQLPWAEVRVLRRRSSPRRSRATGRT